MLPTPTQNHRITLSKMRACLLTYSKDLWTCEDMKKHTKIPASYEEAGRIKAENRAEKVALLSSLSKDERAELENRLRDIVVKDFGGYRSDT